MFAAQDVVVRLGLADAQVRLVSLASRDALSSASREAYESGLEHVLRVGPLGEVPGFSKLVRVRFVDPVYSQDAMALGLRWEATGVSGGLFPVLDGDITLTRIDEHSTRLALVGSYRPPFGSLGAGLDKTILNKVADATIRALLRDLAKTLMTTDPVAGDTAGSTAGDTAGRMSE